jgi:hypothetical protein
MITITLQSPQHARHIGRRAAIRLVRRYLMQPQSGNDGRTLRVGAGHQTKTSPITSFDFQAVVIADFQP